MFQDSCLGFSLCHDFTLGKINLLATTRADVFAIKFVRKDLLFLSTIGTFANEGLEGFQ